MQYESTFNAIDNILRNEAGCSTELDYIEQTSWLLFLKYLDDLEAEREMNAHMAGKDYKRLITGFMRWSQWAAPKKADGTPDDINCMTGPDLQQFVDTKLFPELRKFQTTASSANTLEYKIGEIFAELRNKITSGYNLREIINLVDSLHFQSAQDKHEMTLLYESKIQRMGNAGRNGGEYYTPRPLIRTIVKVVDPKIGETVYDPACGSAGFLCEAFAYMSQKIKSSNDNKILQEKTFFGKEKKPLPYIIATMNMIFHGVQAPNIIRGNTLAENMAQVQEKDRKDVILANPPFGGSERGEVLQNFDLRTSETAYMFMQHFIKMLKAGGRAGIVIKNTFLSNGDAAQLRKVLLEQCNLHTILDLPSGVFQGAGVKTVVLFFDKGKPTKKIWYYQLNPGRNLGKTNALNEEDLADFLMLQKTKADSENSWSIDVSKLGNDCDLSVKNPNKVEEVDERSAAEIIGSLRYFNEGAKALLDELRESYQHYQTESMNAMRRKTSWMFKKIGQVCDIINGFAFKSNEYVSEGIRVIRIMNVQKGFVEDKEPKYYPKSTELELRRYLLKENDLLLSLTGNVGRVALLNGRFLPAYLNQRVACLRIKSEKELDKSFLFHYLNSNLFENDCIKSSRGAAQKNMSTVWLASYLIPVPPLAEQISIVSHLDSVISQIERITENLRIMLEECDTLKQAMLREVFE